MQYENDTINAPSGLPAGGDEILRMLRQGGNAGLRRFRNSRCESQTKFWARFGVSQSNGCRFEMGTPLPKPVALLIRLYADGKWSGDDLL